MALNKTKSAAPRAGTGTLSLGNISDSLEAQTTRTAHRQATEVETQKASQAAAAAARRESTAIAEQSMTSAAATRQQQLEVLGGLNGQLEKARTAMALSDSDNPLDRLNLWFLQQSDPSYTREGNLQRMGYLQEASNMLGNVEVINQQNYTDMLTRVSNQLDATMAEQDDRLKVATLAEAQGQELIDAEVAAQNTRLGIMQTQNSMQSQAMVNLTDEQVAKAVQTASVSPNKAVNVGGVDISLAQLEARQTAIQERRYNERVMASQEADMALANIPPAELQDLYKEALGAKKRIVEVGGVKITAGKIQDRIYAIEDQEYGRLTQQYTMNEMGESLTIKAQDKVLATMEVVEHQALIDNGGIDPVTGQRFNIDNIIAARNKRAENDMLIATQGAQSANLTSPVANAVDAAKYVESIATNIPPTSPYASAFTTAKATINYATSLLGKEGANPQEIQVANQMLTAAREQADNAVSAEATRLAAGDKDLEIAYGYQLRGQAVPRDLIETTIQERAKKGEPIGRWLAPAQNAEFQRVYNATLFAATSPTNPDMPGGMEKTAAQALAFDTAMTAIKNQIAAPMSDALMLMQPRIPGHPINGVIPQDEFAVMVRNADTIGAKQYAEATQKTPEQLAASTGDPELIAAQNAALYQSLERKKPGLGDAYVQWWQSPAREEMVSRYVASSLESAKGDFTKTAEMSLVAPSFQDAMATQSMFLTQGKQNVFAQDLQRQHANYVTFGNNAQTKQIFMLEQTPGLSSTEKQIAMQSVIQPLLDMAAAQGYDNADQVTTFVETQLRSYEPENPQARTVLRKLMTGRDAALKVVDDFISINTGFSALGATGNIATAGAVREIDSSTQFGWYQDLIKTGAGQLPPPRMNPGMK